MDFYDLPVADVPQYNTGLTLDDAMAALAVMTRHGGFGGLTVAEFNPDHAEPDDTAAMTLADALAVALRPPRA